MEKLDHNGPGFHYIVGYKRSDQSRAIEVRVEDYKQGRLVIPGQPVFSEYEIYVRAFNDEGHLPDFQRKKAYSGEDCEFLSLLLLILLYYKKHKQSSHSVCSYFTCCNYFSLNLFVERVLYK